MTRTSALLAALALISLPAFAQSRTVTRTGPAGKTATSTRTVIKDTGGRTISGTTTGPEGQTATHSRTVARDGSNRTVSGTATGPQGKTASRSRTATR